MWKFVIPIYESQNMVTTTAELDVGPDNRTYAVSFNGDATANLVLRHKDENSNKIIIHLERQN